MEKALGNQAEESMPIGKVVVVVVRVMVWTTGSERSVTVTV